ncbi:conjugal transfer protein [Enterococcus gilvus]|uniref:Conjugative transposon membrane protein n=1 Tax=Enterococcus gilvus ATCC BAA-350 TaxID=1158614 RepID=R2XLR7_9ENTE|nr:conjugal transfer protein [Enterococcus gilvus]EOI55473.1 conjugative transposon membrane protein [Enterococcus gilvus ATCC BAA-350]EOW81984.1 conjugative transposon membrane protein [Enterococcus gilvus ATCC BAA-350]OJG43013.1 conjugative transposon membrane protein [Enterococcus gilvus]
MKIIKSYTSIWNVEKVIYAINDLKLPFPITFNQMTWFILSLFTVILLSNVPPLSFIDGALLKYLGIPGFIAWFMSQKSFDGKKPVGFLRSIYRYYSKPKVTFNEKKVEEKQFIIEQSITYVRSEVVGLSN